MPFDEAKPREGFKLLIPHRPDCYAAHDEDGMTFVILDRERDIDWHRTRAGRRGGSTMWWRFRCNDTACKAIMLVRWDVLSRFVSGRTDGA